MQASRRLHVKVRVDGASDGISMQKMDAGGNSANASTRIIKIRQIASRSASARIDVIRSILQAGLDPGWIQPSHQDFRGWMIRALVGLHPGAPRFADFSATMAVDAGSIFDLLDSVCQ